METELKNGINLKSVKSTSHVMGIKGYSPFMNLPGMPHITILISNTVLAHKTIVTLFKTKKVNTYLDKISLNFINDFFQNVRKYTKSLDHTTYLSVI